MKLIQKLYLVKTSDEEIFKKPKNDRVCENQSKNNNIKKLKISLANRIIMSLGCLRETKQTEKLKKLRKMGTELIEKEFDIIKLIQTIRNIKEYVRTQDNAKTWESIKENV